MKKRPKYILSLAVCTYIY